MKKNEIIFLTGATGKVGTQLLVYFLELGSTLVITTRSTEKKAQLEHIHSVAVANKQLIILLQDLVAIASTQKIIQALRKLKLSPTILINNARDVANLRDDESILLDREKWINEYLLDVVIPYELSVSVAAMPHSRLHSIVNVSSIYGLVAQNPAIYDNPQKSLTPNYGAAKAALIQLTKDLAVQLAPAIRVNSVSYGGIAGAVSTSFLNQYKKLSPQRRMLDEDEVIGPIVFLVSGQASAVTGHNLVADGGWTIW